MTDMPYKVRLIRTGDGSFQQTDDSRAFCYIRRDIHDAEIRALQERDMARAREALRSVGRPIAEYIHAAIKGGFGSHSVEYELDVILALMEN